MRKSISCYFALALTAVLGCIPAFSQNPPPKADHDAVYYPTQSAYHYCQESWNLDPAMFDMLKDQGSNSPLTFERRKGPVRPQHINYYVGWMLANCGLPIDERHKPAMWYTDRIISLGDQVAKISAFGGGKPDYDVDEISGCSANYLKSIKPLFHLKTRTAALAWAAQMNLNIKELKDGPKATYAPQDPAFAAWMNWIAENQGKIFSTHPQGELSAVDKAKYEDAKITMQMLNADRPQALNGPLQMTTCFVLDNQKQGTARVAGTRSVDHFAQLVGVEQARLFRKQLRDRSAPTGDPNSRFSANPNSGRYVVANMPELDPKPWSSDQARTFVDSIMSGPHLDPTRLPLLEGQLAFNNRRMLEQAGGVPPGQGEIGTDPLEYAAWARQGEEAGDSPRLRAHNWAMDTLGLIARGEFDSGNDANKTRLLKDYLTHTALAFDPDFGELAPVITQLAQEEGARRLPKPQQPDFYLMSRPGFAQPYIPSAGQWIDPFQVMDEQLRRAGLNPRHSVADLYSAGNSPQGAKNRRELRDWALSQKRILERKARERRGHKIIDVAQQILAFIVSTVDGSLNVGGETVDVRAHQMAQMHTVEEKLAEHNPGADVRPFEYIMENKLGQVLPVSTRILMRELPPLYLDALSSLWDVMSRSEHGKEEFLKLMLGNQSPLSMGLIEELAKTWSPETYQALKNPPGETKQDQLADQLIDDARHGRLNQPKPSPAEQGIAQVAEAYARAGTGNPMAPDSPELTATIYGTKENNGQGTLTAATQGIKEKAIRRYMEQLVAKANAERRAQGKQPLKPEEIQAVVEHEAPLQQLIASYFRDMQLAGKRAEFLAEVRKGFPKLDEKSLHDKAEEKLHAWAQGDEGKALLDQSLAWAKKDFYEIAPIHRMAGVQQLLREPVKDHDSALLACIDHFESPEGQKQLAAIDQSKPEKSCPAILQMDVTIALSEGVTVPSWKAIETQLHNELGARNERGQQPCDTQSSGPSAKVWADFENKLVRELPKACSAIADIHKMACLAMAAKLELPERLEGDSLQALWKTRAGLYYRVEMQTERKIPRLEGRDLPEFARARVRDRNRVQDILFQGDAENSINLNKLTADFDEAKIEAVELKEQVDQLRQARQTFVSKQKQHELQQDAVKKQIGKFDLDIEIKRKQLVAAGIKANRAQVQIYALRGVSSPDARTKDETELLTRLEAWAKENGNTPLRRGLRMPQEIETVSQKIFAAQMYPSLLSSRQHKPNENPFEKAMVDQLNLLPAPPRSLQEMKKPFNQLTLEERAEVSERSSLIGLGADALVRHLLSGMRMDQDQDWAKKRIAQIDLRNTTDQEALAEESRLYFSELAKQCRLLLRDKPEIGESLPIADIDGTVPGENGAPDLVRDALMEFQTARDRARAVVASTTPPGAAAPDLQNPAHKRRYDAALSEFTSGRHGFQMSEAHARTLLDGMEHAVVAERQTQDDKLQTALKAIERKYGITLHWDGSGVDWKRSDLYKITNLEAFRQDLKALSPFGRYASSLTEPWKELFNELFKLHQDSGYITRFQYGPSNAVRLIDPDYKLDPKVLESEDWPFRSRILDLFDLVQALNKQNPKLFAEGAPKANYVMTHKGPGEMVTQADAIEIVRELFEIHPDVLKKYFPSFMKEHPEYVGDATPEQMLDHPELTAQMVLFENLADVKRRLAKRYEELQGPSNPQSYRAIYDHMRRDITQYSNVFFPPPNDFMAAAGRVFGLDARSYDELKGDVETLAKHARTWQAKVEELKREGGSIAVPIGPRRELPARTLATQMENEISHGLLGSDVPKVEQEMWEDLMASNRFWRYELSGELLTMGLSKLKNVGKAGKFLIEMAKGGRNGFRISGLSKEATERLTAYMEGRELERQRWSTVTPSSFHSAATFALLHGANLAGSWFVGTVTRGAAPAWLVRTGGGGLGMWATSSGLSYAGNVLDWAHVPQFIQSGMGHNAFVDVALGDLDSAQSSLGRLPPIEALWQGSHSIPYGMLGPMAQNRPILSFGLGYLVTSQLGAGTTLLEAMSQGHYTTPGGESLENLRWGDFLSKEFWSDPLHSKEFKVWRSSMVQSFVGDIYISSQQAMGAIPYALREKLATGKLTVEAYEQKIKAAPTFLQRFGVKETPKAWQEYMRGQLNTALEGFNGRQIGLIIDRAKGHTGDAATNKPGSESAVALLKNLAELANFNSWTEYRDLFDRHRAELLKLGKETNPQVIAEKMRQLKRGELLAQVKDGKLALREALKDPSFHLGKAPEGEEPMLSPHALREIPMEELKKAGLLPTTAQLEAGLTPARRASQALGHVFEQMGRAIQQAVAEDATLKDLTGDARTARIREIEQNLLNQFRQMDASPEALQFYHDLVAERNRLEKTEPDAEKRSKALQQYAQHHLDEIALDGVAKLHAERINNYLQTMAERMEKLEEEGVPPDQLETRLSQELDRMLTEQGDTVDGDLWRQAHDVFKDALAERARLRAEGMKGPALTRAVANGLRERVDTESRLAALRPNPHLQSPAVRLAHARGHADPRPFLDFLETFKLNGKTLTLGEMMDLFETRDPSKLRRMMMRFRLAKPKVASSDEGKVRQLIADGNLTYAEALRFYPEWLVDKAFPRNAQVSEIAKRAIAGDADALRFFDEMGQAFGVPGDIMRTAFLKWMTSGPHPSVWEPKMQENVSKIAVEILNARARELASQYGRDAVGVDRVFKSPVFDDPAMLDSVDASLLNPGHEETGTSTRVANSTRWVVVYNAAEKLGVPNNRLFDFMTFFTNYRPVAGTKFSQVVKDFQRTDAPWIKHLLSSRKLDPTTVEKVYAGKPMEEAANATTARELVDFWTQGGPSANATTAFGKLTKALKMTPETMREVVKPYLDAHADAWDKPMSELMPHLRELALRNYDAEVNRLGENPSQQLAAVNRLLANPFAAKDPELTSHLPVLPGTLTPDHKPADPYTQYLFKTLGQRYGGGDRMGLYYVRWMTHQATQYSPRVKISFVQPQWTRPSPRVLDAQVTP